ncbi:MAG: hypothetical protein KGY99_08635 [Phycisphaerae bacterium]|nr:hypothetical protein [Phycisphaerae bacterium]
MRKDSIMLVSQQADVGARKRQGSPRVSLAELRNRLAAPERLENRHRQRLQHLAARLARIRALGGEYTGISFSEYVPAATDRQAAV